MVQKNENRFFIFIYSSFVSLFWNLCRYFLHIMLFKQFAFNMLKSHCCMFLIHLELKHEIFLVFFQRNQSWPVQPDVVQLFVIFICASQYTREQLWAANIQFCLYSEVKAEVSSSLIHLEMPCTLNWDKSRMHRDQI